MPPYCIQFVCVSFATCNTIDHEVTVCMCVICKPHQTLFLQIFVLTQRELEMAMGTEKVSLERLWNKYALEEDDQRKKGSFYK